MQLDQRVMAETADVVIVGGGFAGLSAALILGRCRRRTIVLDQGTPRNAASSALHGYLTRDGIKPAEFLETARRQLGIYSTVDYRRTEVRDARACAKGFEIVLDDGVVLPSRKLLLATGVRDHLPDIPGISKFFGSSVFHCPYCDGWEFRDQPVAVYGRGKRGFGLAVELLTWTSDILLCTDGPSRLWREQRNILSRNSIDVIETRIERLEGQEKQLERVVFADGTSERRRALYFSLGQEQRSDLADKLGCRFTTKGAVRTGKYESTNIPGLYVAGDASRDVQFAIVASAEGAEAAFAINTALAQEDLTRTSR